MKDKCVLCGKDTEYEIDYNIGFRQYYINGAGQLCKKCYFELYDEKF